jgi:hypothetical protein
MIPLELSFTSHICIVPRDKTEREGEEIEEKAERRKG